MARKRTRKVKKRNSRKKAYKRQSGGFLLPLLRRLPIDLHLPGYQYCGPGTRLNKRLKRGDTGINRLDRICKQHDIDYSTARGQSDIQKADTKMLTAIDKLPQKTMTENIVRAVIALKRRMNL